tara:strand:- start:300 stop:569 length:270 start_codon:yes stop_codon:yes gene_type:complete
MAGNRFNRLPTTSPFMNAFNTALNTAQAVNDMQVANEIQGLKMAQTRLTSDINILASAVEQELLKMSHKIDEDDSISVSDQIAWFMNSS